MQRDAARVGSLSLDLGVLTVSDAFEAFAEPATRELAKQAELLSSREADLQIIGRVRVHPDFLTTQQRSAEKARTLGDWVSPARMKQVGDMCASAHESLQLRFGQARTTVAALSSTSDNIRSDITGGQLSMEMDACHERSRSLLQRLKQLDGRHYSRIT